jgi:hypothetical protein
LRREEYGFNVTLAFDAMADGRAEAHDYRMSHVFAKLGETGPAQEIIDLLETRNSKWNGCICCPIFSAVLFW